MMKNLIFFSLILCFLSCKAQNIVPIYGDSDIYVDNSGDYYKDVDNDFNAFIGEWKWENGNSSFTIKLQKLVQLYDSDANHYEDIMIGEYRYIENGVELVNTLGNFDNTSIDAYDHKINGALILAKHHLPPCETCADDERRLQLSLEHPDSHYVKAKFVLRYSNNTGNETITAILQDNSFNVRPDGSPENIDIPYGEYVLIKQ